MRRLNGDANHPDQTPLTAESLCEALDRMHTEYDRQYSNSECELRDLRLKAQMNVCEDLARELGWEL